MRSVLLLSCAAQLAAAPLLTPPPRLVEWTGERFRFEDPMGIDARPEETRAAARWLAGELRGTFKLTVALPGKARLGGIRFRVDPSLGPEGYSLIATEEETVIRAASQRGFLYAAGTLVQLVEPGGRVWGARIRDAPTLPFRGVHLCIFPGTDLRAVRRAILMAARFRYNAVVIEPWASLASPSHPYTAYEHAYTARELRPLVELARSRGMDVIPALNSWGHASGMRSRSREHVVLDRFPEKADLFEPGGWSFCLSNPAIYGMLFDRYAELMEMCGPSDYFHAGMDEAWGFAGYQPCPRCRGKAPHELIAGHLLRIHDRLGALGRRTIVWHDMFLRPDDPELGRVSPANSRPPVDSHLALGELPKDAIVNAWNYDAVEPWPVPAWFQKRGYQVIVSPWKSRANTVMMVNTAKQLGLLGVLQTTWDSLDVCLPSIGEAGVLAWAPPGFDLRTVPFDHWVEAIRALR